MAGLAIDHTDPLIPQLPQITNEPASIPDGQGNRYRHIGPGEQEFLFGSGGAGHTRQNIHFTRLQHVLGRLSGARNHPVEANIQVLLQAFDQVRGKARRAAVLLELKRWPIATHTHFQPWMTFQPLQLRSGQGHATSLKGWHIRLQPGLANIPVLVVTQCLNGPVKHPKKAVTAGRHLQHNIHRAIVQQNGQTDTIDHCGFKVIRDHRYRSKEGVGFAGQDQADGLPQTGDGHRRKVINRVQQWELVGIATNNRDVGRFQIRQRPVGGITGIHKDPIGQRHHR